MILKSSIFKVSIFVVGLTVSVSPVCQGSEPSLDTGSKPGSCAPEGCVADLPQNSGCGETGCGEEVDCLGLRLQSP